MLSLPLTCLTPFLYSTFWFLAHVKQMQPSQRKRNLCGEKLPRLKWLRLHKVSLEAENWSHCSPANTCLMDRAVGSKKWRRGKPHPPRTWVSVIIRPVLMGEEVSVLGDGSRKGWVEGRRGNHERAGEDYKWEKFSLATNMFNFLSLSTSECFCVNAAGLHLHESWLLSSSTNDEMREGMPDSLSTYYKSCWEVWSLFSSPGCAPGTHIYYISSIYSWLSRGNRHMPCHQERWRQKVILN